jgi:hypothetical protein
MPPGLRVAYYELTGILSSNDPGVSADDSPEGLQRMAAECSLGLRSFAAPLGRS